GELPAAAEAAAGVALLGAAGLEVAVEIPALPLGAGVEAAALVALELVHRGRGAQAAGELAGVLVARIDLGAADGADPGGIDLPVAVVVETVAADLGGAFRAAVAGRVWVG